MVLPRAITTNITMPQRYPEAIIIGENVRRLRDQRAWTQVELARQLGVRQTQVNNYEHGACSPSIRVLKTLSQIFDVSIDALVHKDAPSKEHIADRALLKLFVQADELDYTAKSALKQIIEGLIAREQLKKVS